VDQKILAATLFETGALAYTIAQEIELGAPHLAVAHDLNLFHTGAVQSEHALDADAMGADLAHGEAGSRTRAVFGNDCALKHLHTLVLSLDNAVMHLDDIANLNFGGIFFELLVFQRFQEIGHDIFPHSHNEGAAVASFSGSIIAIKHFIMSAT